jgi:uncharacterized protein (DUF1330 family)
MKKGYWIVAYRSVSDPSALKDYGKLAVPAIEAGGGKTLIRTADAIEPRESGLKQRIVVTEFESFEKAVAVYNSQAYQAALKVLGSAAERDFRIAEGVD